MTFTEAENDTWTPIGRALGIPLYKTEIDGILFVSRRRAMKKLHIKTLGVGPRYSRVIEHDTYEDIKSVHLDELLNAVETVHTHPVHYLVQRAYWPDNDHLKHYSKQFEIQAGAMLYARFGDSYQITYQRPVDTKKVDYCLELFDPINQHVGVYVEIDERGHSGYDPIAENARDALIGANPKYEVVRMRVSRTCHPNMELVNIALKDQRLTFAKNLNIADMIEEIRKRDIPMAFMEVVRPRFDANGSQFCIKSEDIAEYCQYDRVRDMMKHSSSSIMETVHYVTREYTREKGSKGPAPKSYLFSLRGLYMILITGRKPICMKSREYILDVYDIALNMERMCRDRIHAEDLNFGRSIKMRDTYHEHKDDIRYLKLERKYKELQTVNAAIRRECQELKQIHAPPPVITIIKLYVVTDDDLDCIKQTDFTMTFNRLSSKPMTLAEMKKKLASLGVKRVKIDNAYYYQGLRPI